MEYLGHIIFKEGVATDPEKVIAMKRWPKPSTLKDLRGFLRLTGYYRRFIKGYRSISKLLIELLKKENFHWDETTQKALEKLKEVMSTAPVLAMPNYSLSFTLEVDANGYRIGAILTQQGRPIVYLSKGLSERNRALSTYEKEFLAILLAVEK